MRVSSAETIVSTVHPLSSHWMENETAQSCSTFATDTHKGFQFTARIYRLFSVCLSLSLAVLPYVDVISGGSCGASICS